MRTIAIPSTILKHYDSHPASDTQQLESIRKGLAGLLKGEPEVSIVIPAYNEEKTILQTLSSLAANKTARSVEIIVVNNNSQDRTEELVVASGAKCIRETKQGITNARNGGLKVAKGTYIVNADADTIYPPDWIEMMVHPLAKDPRVALTYGQFSFIPVGTTNRTFYFFYEYATDLVRLAHAKFREEAVNVYGFNSAFRRAQGEVVDGFNHPPGTNEDGWLALKLREKGFGRLHCVTQSKALVWTTDRRIQIDGGVMKATKKRLKRFFTKNNKTPVTA